MKKYLYIVHLLKFAYAENKLLYGSLLLAVFSVFIELLAMSSLLPLFEMVSGKSSVISGPIKYVLQICHVQATVPVLLWCFIVLFAMRLISLLVSQVLTLYLGRKVQAQLGSAAFNSIMKSLSLGEINQKSIGFYTNIAGDEASRASTLVINITQFISAGILSVLYFFAIYQFSSTAALFIVIFLAVCGLILMQIMKQTHKYGALSTVESRNLNSWFLDGVNNLKAVRAFNAESYIADEYRKKIFKYTTTTFIVDAIPQLTKFIPIILLLFFSSMMYAFSSGSIEAVGIAFIVTLIIYLMRFFPAIGVAVQLFLRIASDAKSGQDIISIVSSIGQLENCNNKQSLDVTIQLIALDNVAFKYPSADACAFSNVHYQFIGGKSYALVGPSGIGKSTLIDLLLKFLEPSEGSIFYNDTNYLDLHAPKLREKVLLISQEPAIFDDTVLNNICMGKAFSTEQVEAACKLACIDDVISAMENGYHTRLQYQGKNISGGQRQRIALARALLRSPDVLILDESTSALDKTTQQQVVTNILKAYADKIVIFVTHDPIVAEQVSHTFDLREFNAKI